MPLNLTDDKSTLVQVMACAIRQQAITWSNVDSILCRHMASLGYNELKHRNRFKMQTTHSMTFPSFGLQHCPFVRNIVLVFWRVYVLRGPKWLGQGARGERTWKVAAIFSWQIYILYYLLTTFMDYTWRSYNLWYGRYFIRYVRTLLVTFECMFLYYRPPLNALFTRLSSASSGCSVSTRSQGIPTPVLVPGAPVMHGWLLAALLNNAWQRALRAIGPGADGIP